MRFQSAERADAIADDNRDATRDAPDRKNGRRAAAAPVASSATIRRRDARNAPLQHRELMPDRKNFRRELDPTANCGP